MRVAALLSWVLGLGFGLSCVYGIWYFADPGYVWTFLGFPTYGGGPFEDAGIVTTVPLLVLFLLVCVAERRRVAAVAAAASRRPARAGAAAFSNSRSGSASRCRWDG